MKCVLYARVSTDAQADKELSIPAQLAAMRQYASDRNWSICSEFLETGASGRTADRPALRALLSRCRRDDDPINVVLVHKVDRLTRNLSDHIAIKTLLRERGITLASVVENLDDSNSGQLIEHIMASLAEFYSANLSEEVKKGMRQKVLGGGWPHQPPRGYRLVGIPDTPGRALVIDQVDGPIIRWAFETYCQYPLSLRTLAEQMAVRGFVQRDGKRVPVSFVAKMLRNPFYFGLIRWAGEIHTGSHPPLVSEAVFVQVQASLQRRATAFIRQGPRGAVLYRIATCVGCQRPLSASATRNRPYYHCVPTRSIRCKQPFVRVEPVHQAMRRLYSQIRVSAKVKRMLHQAIRQARRSRILDRERQHRALREQLHLVDQRGLILADRFGARLMDERAFDTASATLRADRSKIEQRVQLLVEVSTEVSVGEPRTLWDAHKDLPFDCQQVLARLVFAQVVLGPEGIRSYRLNHPFDQLLAPRRKSAA